MVTAVAVHVSVSVQREILSVRDRIIPSMDTTGGSDAVGDSDGAGLVSGEPAEGADLARILGGLGSMARARRRYDAARGYYEDRLAIQRESGDDRAVAGSLTDLGAVALARDAVDAAERYYEEALAIQTELGDDAGAAKNLGNLGIVARERDDHERAREYFRRSVDVWRDVGDDTATAANLHNLGLVARKQGDDDLARECYEESVELFVEAGDVERALQSIENLVRIDEATGRSTWALARCDRAFALVEESEMLATGSEARRFSEIRARLRCREPETRVPELHALGCMHVLEGDAVTAAELHEAAWRLHVELRADGAVFGTAVAAGIAVVAWADVDDGPAVAVDRDELLETASRRRDELGRGPRVVLSLLADGRADRTPAELREYADGAVGFDHLEADAFARLAESIRDR